MEFARSHKTEVVEDFENDQHFLQLWAKLSRKEEEQRDREEEIKKMKEELEKSKKEILKQKASRKLPLGVTENYQSYSEEKPDTEKSGLEGNITIIESDFSPRYEEGGLLESETLTYEKKHGVIDTSGYMYEVKVCALIFLKLINLKAKFYMCNNFKEAGVFDDVVVQYSYENGCGEMQHHSLFMQLKHFSSDKEKTMSFLEGDFPLEKYFRSFCQTQSKVLQKHEIFNTPLSNRQYVIFTNGSVKTTIISEDDNASWFVDSISSGDILVVDESKMETELEVYKQFCCIAKNILSNENVANCEKEMEKFLKISNCKYLYEVWRKSKRKKSETLKIEHVDLNKLPSFLSTLKICIKQFDVKKIDTSIKNEIKSCVSPIIQRETELVFGKLVKEIETWRNESNYYLTENWIKWKEIITENEYSRFRSKIVELSKIPVRFKETYLEQLQKILSKSIFSILVSDDTQTTLLCLKIWQILEKSYKRKYVFLKVKEFINSKNFLWKIWPVKWCEIIVVDCEGCKDFDGIYENVKRISNGNKDCRIVLISIQSQDITKVSIEEECKFIKYHEPSYLYQLDSDSQTLLTDKQINFQGKLTALKDVLSLEDISSDALTYFIFNDVIILGRDIRELQTCEYVERNISLPYVSEDIFKDNELEAVLAVEINEDTSTLEMYKKLTMTVDELHKKCNYLNNQDLKKNHGCVILTHGREEENFQVICNVFRHVCWLKRESGKWLLVKTKGDLNILRKYLIEERKELSEASFIEECQNPKIITAVSGMGKTSLLHHLALLLKDRYPSKWMVVIHLLDHCEYLSKVKTMDKQCVVDIIKHALELNSVQTQLLTKCANNLKSFVILVDAFDEIAPNFTEITTQIIQYLCDMCFCVILTSRPTHKTYLESNFSVISYTLEPFTNDMKRDFVFKALAEAANSTELPTFTAQVLKQCDRINDCSGNILTDNPLLLKMLVKTYGNSEKSSDNGVPYNNHPMNILQLYDEFVTGKINILFREKKRSDIYNPLVQQDFDKYKAEFLNMNKQISAQQIFGSGYFSTEQGDYTDSNICKYLRNERENLIKTGVVLNVGSKGKVTYIHRTFAEYFSALWLADNYSDYLSIFTKMHREQEFNLVLLFFNLKNAVNSVPHTSLLCGNSYEGLNMNENEQVSLQKDAMGRTLLHLSSMYNNVKHTETLLNKTGGLLLRESFIDNIGWSPIKYAALKSSFDILDILLTNKWLPTDPKFLWDELVFAIDEIIYQSVLNNYENVLEFVSKNTNLNEQFFIPKGVLRLNTPFRKYKGTSKKYLPLHLAVEHKNSTIIKLLIHLRCDISLKDEEGYTLCHIACCNGDVDLVKYLHQEGIDQHCATNEQKLTPLHIACIENHTDVVNELIAHGTSLNDKTDEDETPIMLAINHGHTKLVKMLIKTECRVDSQVIIFASKFGNSEMLDIIFHENSYITEDDIGTFLRAAILYDNMDTLKYYSKKYSHVINYVYSDSSIPLLIASRKGHTDILKYLVALGADVAYIDIDGETALTRAVYSGNIETVKYCVENGLDVNHVMKNGYIPVLIASDRGYTDIIKYLVDHGADISYIDNNGNTALTRAVYSGNIETVKYCVEKGLDVNHVMKNADIPVLLASEGGYTDILKYLVDHGADISYIDSKGNTALTRAMNSGNIETVKYCIEKGLDVNHVMKNADIPVLLASEGGYTDILKYLVDHGADISYIDSKGNTALTRAVNSGNIETVKYCVEKGLDVNHVMKNGGTPVLLASEREHTDILKYLVDHGADISYIDSNGNTALTRAVYIGNIETVKYCVDKGLDVNHVKKNGGTPVLLASFRGHTDILKYLVEHGANISCIDNNGETALTRAVYSGNIESVKYCVKEGLDVKHVKKNGDTSVLLASEGGYTDILKYLVDHGADISYIDSNGNTSLTRAVYSSNIETVKYCEEKGLDVNHVMKNGDTSVLLASEGGYTDILKYLVDHGADISYIDSNGNTSLTRAVYSGNIETVKYCVEKGLDVNHVKKNGSTSVLLASERGHTDILKYLVDHGADISYIDSNGNTALTRAVYSGNIETVKYCVEKGLDVKHVKNSDVTPVLLASVRGHTDILIYLVEHGADISYIDSNGNTALTRAVYSGNIETVKYCVEEGLDVNHARKNGYTPVLLAIARGLTDILKYLVEHGADISYTLSDGETALTRAVYSGNIETVKYCVEKDLDVNHVKKNGGTPVLLASEREHTDILKYLVDNGADISYTDSNGNTALTRAVYSGNIETVKYCVEKGLDVKHVKNNDVTPVLLASVRGHTDILKYLIDHGADISCIDSNGETPLTRAVYIGNIETVKYCVEKGVDVNHVKNNGVTPVLLASVRGHTDILKYLVEHGADISYIDSNSNTALTRAVYSGNIETVKYCVDKGLDVNHVREDSYTPVLLASGKGHTGVLKYLVEHGASLSYIDRYGHTALTLAVFIGNIETVKYCVEKGLDVNHMTKFYDTPVLLASEQGHTDILKYLLEHRGLYGVWSSVWSSVWRQLYPPYRAPEVSL